VEGDRVLLTSDSDLTAAIEHAKSAGWKVIIFLFILETTRSVHHCLFYNYIISVCTISRKLIFPFFVNPLQCAQCGLLRDSRHRTWLPDLSHRLPLLLSMMRMTCSYLRPSCLQEQLLLQRCWPSPAMPPNVHTVGTKSINLASMFLWLVKEIEFHFFMWWVKLELTPNMEDFCYIADNNYTKQVCAHPFFMLWVWFVSRYCIRLIPKC